MHNLYLINNPENPKSFEFVWTHLIQILDMKPIQAEQCCLIAQERGRAHLKQGNIVDLLSLQASLEAEGITIELTEQ